MTDAVYPNDSSDKIGGASSPDRPAAQTGETSLLQPLTAALLECVTPEDVVAVVVERGVSLLDAEAGLVVLVRDDTENSDSGAGHGYLEIIASRGYSDAVTQAWARFSLADPLPLSDAVRENVPLFSTGRTHLEERYPEMFRRGPLHTVKASVSLPLVARGRAFGGLHFSFPTERVFSDADRAFLLELARQCSLALERALLLQEREEARGRMEFLARASALLGESLDYPSRLEALARLCVPELADWAGVDVLDENGKVVRLVVAHRLPEREAVMRELQVRYPSQPGRNPGPLTVIQTGERFFAPYISPEMIEQSAINAEHASLLNQIGLRAALSLPLTTRGRTLGALSLGMGPASDPSGSGRSFSPETVALAEELALRAAIAVDNARLYQERQREVQERTEAERALQTSEEILRVSEGRYRRLLESIQEGILFLDAQGRIAAINLPFARMLGYDTVEEVVGQDMYFLFFPEEEWLAREKWAARLAGVQENYELRLRARDNSERWFIAHVAIEYAEDTGAFLGTFTLLTNITQRKKTENALRESEERFRVMADQAPVFVWMTDVEGRCTFLNKPWQEFTGRTPEQEAITRFTTVIHPDDLERIGRLSAVAFAARKPILQEYRLRRHDGSYRWMLDNGVPRFDASGAFVGYIGSCIDITERKLAEEEQARSRRQIERAARERERLVTELQESNLRQRRFLKEMLLGFTEGRLRLCDRRQELAPALPPLSDIVELSTPTLRALRKHIVTVAEELGLTQARLADFVTAAHEAAMNAVRHAGGGSARVHGDRNSGTIQVWIEDYGPGIAEEMIHRAVERGFTTGGFGQGFFYMQSCADRLWLLTGPNGTTVVLEMDRTAPEPAWLKNVGVTSD